MAVAPASRLASIFRFDNPVVIRDLRARMRGGRTHWLLFGYLGFLSVAAYLAYQQWWLTQQYSQASSTYAAGNMIFTVMFIIQGVLLSLITPALTSGAISMERQQRTFELLRATTMASRTIVMGKLLASLSFVTLLMVASLPVVAISFLLGGVSPAQVLATSAMLLCDAALFGAVGLMWSSCCNSTAAATGLTYFTVFIYFIATVSWAGVAAMGGPRMGGQLTALNPIGALSAGAVTETYYGHINLPAWLTGLLVNGSLTVILLLVSMNRIEEHPAPRRRLLLRAGILAVLAFLMVLCDGATRSLMMGPLSGQALWMGYVVLGAVFLFVPPLATGSIDDDDPAERPRNMLASWLPPSTFMRVTVDSGASMAVWVGIVAALSSIAAAGLSTSGQTPWARMVANPASNVHAAVTMGMGLVAITFGIGGVGRLCSYLCRSRWVSAAWVYTLVACAAYLPYITYDAVNTMTGGRQADALANTLYLSPIAVAQAATFHGGGNPPLPQMSQLVFAGSVSPVVVMSALYILIGLAGFALARVVRARRLRAEEAEPATPAAGAESSATA